LGVGEPTVTQRALPTKSVSNAPSLPIADIVVLAGAGASYAVSKQNFPTTLQFLEKLEKANQLESNSLYASTKSIVAQQLANGGPIDIEHILWRLQEMVDHLDPILRDGSTIQRALHGGAFSGIVNNAAPQHYVNFVPQIREAVCRLRDDINAALYDTYSQQATRAELTQTWIPFLKLLADQERNVAIFTTNYDGILEDAADYQPFGGDNRSLEFGFTRDARPQLIDSYWLPAADSSNAGKTRTNTMPVVKLHGSLDWELVSGKIRKSTPTFKGDHARHPVIYPGYKGYPTIEPFRSFHRYFEDALKSCETLVVVGFAFRDQAISDAIVAAKSMKKMIVVDPTEVLNIPNGVAASIVAHIKAGFEASQPELALALTA
jgi:NAD-dependent SIR2 family protein deacetylase